MNRILLIIGIFISTFLQAQGECLMAYESHHFVHNLTADTVTIWKNNRNQKSFPTDGPEMIKIAPDDRVEVSELSWAEEFRDPTGWYVFKVEPLGLTRLCDSYNWHFNKLSETQAEYSLALTVSNLEDCEIDIAKYFGAQIPREEIESEIVDFASPEAKFPGGPSAMMKWISNNIQYPQAAIEDSVMGKVYVQFVVEKNGELSNFKILRSPHESLSKESIRVISSMPKWEPARMEGEAVRMRYNLPIAFRMD